MQRGVWHSASGPEVVNRVEVCQDPEGGDWVLVRNPQDPDTALWFTRAEWDAFLAGVRNGEFDERVP